MNLSIRAALLLALLFSVAAPAAAQERTRCFRETGFCVSGRILDYWERNGGLPIFGYPIGEQYIDTVEPGPNSWTGPVQWFERDRLEDHSNQGLGVLAGRLALDRVSPTTAGEARDRRLELVDFLFEPDDLPRLQGLGVVRVDSGGALNGALLAAGLVDEISLLVHPLLVGDAPRWYGASAPLALEMAVADTLDGGLVWLRYRASSE